jgi:CBS-domain-containing membrane protein
MHPLLARWLDRFGAEHISVSHGERLISAVGGFVALLAVLAISRWMLDTQGAMAMIASMGATAVLVFAVPHGTLSQPWSVVGGHGVSAIIGVGCATWLPDPVFAAPFAVGLAIAAMHYLRCMHPPGGATALTAVIGGEAVQALGFQFVFTPVLLNAVVLLIYGVAFNAPFPWRRYPAWLAPRTQTAPEPDGLSTGDLEWALRQMDSYIDVSEDDLRRLFTLAQQHARAEGLETRAVAPGGCYSNGQFGERWEVRKVISDLGGEEGAGRVVYRVVAGDGRGASGICTREEFARWARYKVVRNENCWLRAPALAT